MQAKLCDLQQVDSSMTFHQNNSFPSALNQNGLPLQYSPRTWLSQMGHETRPSNRCVLPKHVLNVCSRECRNLVNVCKKDASQVDAFEVISEKDLVGDIKKMLDTIGDGRITVSPYDTAWLALIRNLDGSDTPQFPSSLEWIVKNQLEDGSWGDALVFSAYDRLLNTLACVIAMKSWKVHMDKSEKGITFMKENIHKLESEKTENMTCGFEVIFPALLERAVKLGIDLPYGTPVIKEIKAVRERKLNRIPMELMHDVPTSLLFSLEGLQDLNWKMLLKLQTPLGSFLTSPSSTAFAFIETKDENCLRFLTDIVQKFRGGAPHSWPSDMFARLWAIDRLQRLGISHFFDSEFKDILDYVYRFWTKAGIFSGRFSGFSDIDDTSMGFRLLRLHGYDINPDVFENFRMDGKFSCYGGQMIESASPIFNLYRASQVQFPGEKILEQAKEFSYNFLQERLASGQLLDKWVISEGLADEITYGLEVPWYANLPRVETKFYIEQYGGAEDVWIGKSLYRMPDINNNMYLDLAKLDYNRCQTRHQIEWKDMQEWYENGNFQELGISRKCLLSAYFLAASSIFEPERSLERLAWAKSQIISKMITSYLNGYNVNFDKRTEFLSKFRGISRGQHKAKLNETERGILNTLLETIEEISVEALKALNTDISHRLHAAWEAWLTKRQGEAKLLVTIINICGGHILSQDILSHANYKDISGLTDTIFWQLNGCQNEKVLKTEKRKELEKNMQRLLQLVLDESDAISKDIKKTFVLVTKTFCYTAYFGQDTIDMHIAKVLFERVV